MKGMVEKTPFGRLFYHRFTGTAVLLPGISDGGGPPCYGKDRGFQRANTGIPDLGAVKQVQERAVSIGKPRVRYFRMNALYSRTLKVMANAPATTGLS